MAMHNNIKHSVLTLETSENLNSLATVVLVSHYEAMFVTLPGSSQEYKIVAHLNNVPPLQEGDQVLVLNTQQGLVVTGCIRAESESPLDGLSYKNGKLNLRAGKSIKIQSGPAVIELTADGKIKIDGKNIYSISEGRHRLQGATIELN